MNTNSSLFNNYNYKLNDYNKKLNIIKKKKIVK